MSIQFGTPLREYVAGKSQVKVAEQLGVTQGAISQMLLSGRDVRVVIDGSGKAEGYELRRVGSRRKQMAA